ncbi:MAG: hypothetical protein DMG14_34905 [Acidobacteria bacterium]|nr:MAG: hypothetical protein DMG14_34905 [Acidobacteriota bacterium]
MTIVIGQQLGSYEITALLGKGGMGEVYRARDTKLKREIAIKILPEEFSLDPDRVNRFQREAEVLASLNHPNIAAIHNIEEANGSRFLVLELVDGETLADRIARGSIPVEEALGIAESISQALEAAHEKGIIHRDLKPANVKITPDGKRDDVQFANYDERNYGRHDSGNGRLYVARTGPRQSCGQASGHLGIWGGSFRDAHRQAAFQWRHDLGYARGYPPAGTRLEPGAGQHSSIAPKVFGKRSEQAAARYWGFPIAARIGGANCLTVASWNPRVARRRSVFRCCGCFGVRSFPGNSD